MLFDLAEQRRLTLARVEQLILENAKVLASLDRTSPNRRLVAVLLKRLKTQADKLRCGLVDRRNAAE